MPSEITLARQQITALAIAADRPLDLLPPQLASCVEVREKTWNDPDYGLSTEFVGYALPATIDADKAAIILRKLEAAMPPATINELASALARVRALTKGRALDDADAELTVQAFAEELSEYPGQLVLETLRYWPSRSEWFPTWCELKDLLRLRGGRTMALLESLRERVKRRNDGNGEFSRVARDISRGTDDGEDLIHAKLDAAQVCRSPLAQTG